MSKMFVFARNAPAAEYDRSLAWAALLLAAAGLVMVYSASIATAEANRYTGNSAAWTRCAKRISFSSRISFVRIVSYRRAFSMATAA